MLSKRFKATSLLCLVFVVTASNAETLSNTELTERLIKLEEQNQKLKNKLNGVNEKTGKRIAALNHTLSQQSDRIRFNGFMSAMASKNNKNVDMFYESIGLDDHWSFSPDSIVGLQWDYTVADKASATVQLVSKGSNSFETEAEWAYIKYQFSDALSARAGRLRFPLYAKSETFEVGFSYPWVRPPVEVYVADVTSFEGVALNYRDTAGNWLLEYQFVYGSVNDLLTKVRGDAGINIVANNGPINLSFIYIRSDKIIITSFESLIDPSALEYIVASVGYDDGVWDILFEAANAIPSRDSAIAGLYSGYLSIGYRINRFTPYLLQGGEDSEADEEERASKIPAIALSPVDYRTHSKNTALGLRYDINARVALKFEASYFYDMDDRSRNRFKIVDLTAAIPTVIPGKKEELGSSATVLTMGVDLIF